MCREPRPCWIPSSTWLLRSDVLSGIPVAGVQLHLRVPNWLGSASAGVAVTTVAASAIAAPTNNFSMIKDAPLGCRYPSMRIFSGSRMTGAERGDADADEESSMVAVQTTLLHDVVRDVA